MCDPFRVGVLCDLSFYKCVTLSGSVLFSFGIAVVVIGHTIAVLNHFSASVCPHAPQNVGMYKKLGIRAYATTAASLLKKTS